jgi:flagellar hook assembly protein FlgD
VISYAVKDGGQTTIRVYNVAGKVVRTLLDRELAAGTSGRVVWDGTDDAGERCAAGVYFYRILATGFSSSGKMVLLR